MTSSTISDTPLPPIEEAKQILDAAIGDLPEKARRGPKPGSHKARSQSGLTPKQEQSVPIYARAYSRYRAVQEMVAKGIVGSTSYFYAVWWKQENYRNVCEATREIVMGSAREGSINLFVHFAEENAYTILKLAREAVDERVRLTAARAALHPVGVDTGLGSSINVNAQANASASAAQVEFKDLLTERLRRRAAILANGTHPRELQEGPDGGTAEDS